MSFSLKETIHDLVLASVDFISNLYNSIVCWLFHSIFNYPTPGLVYVPEQQNAIFITGCSTGIGRSAALFLAEAGFSVFATVRKEADADNLRSEAKGNIIPVIMDVTKLENIQQAFNFVSDHLKQHEMKLIAIVNNAGVGGCFPLELASEERIANIINTNTLGPLRIMQLLIPLLRPNQGRIVNVSSAASFFHPPYFGLYSASKAALDTFTNVLRLELIKWNIKVCSVQPGVVRTAIWEKTAVESISSEIESCNASIQATHYYTKSIQKVIGLAHNTKDIIPCSTIHTSNAIFHAITARYPQNRYLVGFDAKLLDWLVSVIPQNLLELLVSFRVEK